VPNSPALRYGRSDNRRTGPVAGIILAQLIPFADPKSLQLLDAFEKAVYAALD